VKVRISGPQPATGALANVSREARWNQHSAEFRRTSWQREGGEPEAGKDWKFILSQKDGGLNIPHHTRGIQRRFRVFSIGKAKRIRLKGNRTL